jgi:hypothetical protein
MAKLIRSTYPLEFSIGLLLLIFVLSSFLSSQIFSVTWRELTDGNNALFGMFLIGIAVVIDALVLWEEFLFPIHVKPTEDEVVFRNHRHKLKIQTLIFLLVPIIFTFVYLNYQVNHVRFFIWATVCLAAPVAGKLISGIRNYNDFLRFTGSKIEYKNNEETGNFPLSDIHHIVLIKDENKVLHKIQLLLNNNHEVTIDLDEMELEALYESIDQYITLHYKALIK